ncbi:MAG TPA: SPOR domain-containing protein [Candidatus Limivivens merdigallinarum]|uniref:SPOR domain-containing protein n=1 Tax=Candidatus Limivivens merdigallinarum TaxID=2840859 RepID=A0A9D0ZVK4_9FIRM|nr:SPOR domain-containing protein [Candidatus Limivivens merdigallinarum]
MNLNIKTSYMTNNPCYKKGASRKAIGLQLHTIGAAQGSAEAIRDSMNRSDYEAAVNAIVDSEEEGKVLLTLPDGMRSWADGGYGNQSLYTFEIGESDAMKYVPGTAEYTVTDEKRFKEDILRGYRNAVAFCAAKCRENGWDPLSKLGSGLYTISSHDEGRRAGLSTAHVDPTHIWDRLGLTMDQFRKDVKTAMENASAPGGQGDEAPSGSGKSWYKVQCGAFKSEEKAKAMAAELKKKGVDTFVFQDGGWYKVQCGAYEKKTNADRQKKQLEELGYEAFVTV